VTLAAGSVIVATATRPTTGTSEFSGQITLSAGPLPVELTEFTARNVRNKDAALAWRTASEKNNDHFDVERSFDGTAFAKIGQVAGHGSTLSPNSYALTDAGVARLATGAVYYRLRQVDTDGTATYSPVRTVAFAQVANPAISLFPNPATAATQLDLTELPAGAYQVSVLDATGRTVLRHVLTAGSVHLLDLSSCASGTFLVLVRGQNGGSGSVFTKRLAKE
jgi:hypothetical protein